MNYNIVLYTFNKKTKYKEILFYDIPEDVAIHHIDALCYCLKFEFLNNQYIIVRYETFDNESNKILDFNFLKESPFEK